MVVASYNRRAALERTVEGVMAQDLDVDLELIVVDNGSTDGTAEYLAAAAETSRRPIVTVRLDSNLGPAARSAGIDVAGGDYIAFTDSDCEPDPGWLRAALAAFDRPDVGIVQGRTEAAHDNAPLFSHYIVTDRLDGSFSTSNIVYRRQAIADLRFDASCIYWEDTDFGWRVFEKGWRAVFAPAAVVRHEVVPISPLRWVAWPRHFQNYPQKAARYPGFRKHLFMGVWVSPMSLCFELALAGVALARWNPAALLLGVPYVVQFARTRGLKGRFPPAKVAAHVAWDAVTLASLLAGSVRNRSVVL